jgi:hypothetical protein
MDNNYILKPMTVVNNKWDYQLFLSSKKIKHIREIEEQLVNAHQDGCFGLDGYCIPCNKDVQFVVDMQFGGYHNEQISIQNWMERLECPICKMNNRQRLIALLVNQSLIDQAGKNIYFMEQVTPNIQLGSNSIKWT